MSDNDIIKALECCTSEGGCIKCPLYKPEHTGTCVKSVFINALDLINRQEAEIERLTINMNAFGLGMKREHERADTVRIEAINEFAEKLINYINDLTFLPYTECAVSCIKTRIKLMSKEMTEEQK